MYSDEHTLHAYVVFKNELDVVVGICVLEISVTIISLLSNKEGDETRLTLQLTGHLFYSAHIFSLITFNAYWSTPGIKPGRTS